MKHTFVLNNIKETTIPCKVYSTQGEFYIIETMSNNKSFQLKIPFRSILFIETEIENNDKTNDVSMPKV